MRTIRVPSLVCQVTTTHEIYTHGEASHEQILKFVLLFSNDHFNTCVWVDQNHIRAKP